MDIDSFSVLQVEKISGRAVVVGSVTTPYPEVRLGV